MKLMLKGFLCLMLLVSGGLSWNARAGDNNGLSDSDTDCETISCGHKSGDVLGWKTHFSLRPQDSNNARKMVGVMDKIHRYGVEELNGVFSVGLQYQQTWKPEKLAKYLFGKEILSYGPECNGTFDIYGPNLGTLGSGTLRFQPRIQNFIADLDLWLGLDEFVCGLWARIGVPINWTKWNLKPCERRTVDGSGLFFESGVLDFEGTPSVASAAGILEQLETGRGFGLAPEMGCARICRRGDHTTQVAGLHLDLGYDFLRRECGWLGASVHVVAPTGNRPKDKFLFNAVSGPQRSWQIGATLTAGYELWANCDGDQNVGVYFEGTITHLFAARQRRVFDLKSATLTGTDGNALANPMSYWLLLKKFDPATGQVIGLERAANRLCCEVKIGAKVMADLALMLQYNCGCMSAGVGYNFWIRSCERFKNRKSNFNTRCGNRTDSTCGFPPNTFGIKGQAPVGALPDGDPTTYSKATIGNCGPADASPVYLTNDNIDRTSILHPRAWSNKVFGWVGYNWSDCEWQPFVALEGEAEFGKDNVAADQWGVMLKGGVAF